VSKSSDRLLSQLQQYLMQNIASATAAGEQESPYLASLGKEATGYEDFLRAGNYNDSPAGHQLNRTPLALMKRASDLNDNPLTGQTQGRSMTPSSGSYQLNNLDRQDKFAAASADARQQNVNQNADANTGLLLGLGGLDDNRRVGAAHNVQNLLGTYFSMANNKKPSFLKRLVGGGLTALPGVLAAI
jgi:hypothetical protein